VLKGGVSSLDLGWWVWLCAFYLFAFVNIRISFSLSVIISMHLFPLSHHRSEIGSTSTPRLPFFSSLPFLPQYRRGRAWGLR
jgi:hypothetical protein